MEEKVVSIVVDRKHRKRNRPGTRYNLHRHDPSDLIPPARPDLLKFPIPPKIMPPAVVQAFNT
jgi:hypothetical protein